LVKSTTVEKGRIGAGTTNHHHQDSSFSLHMFFLSFRFRFEKSIFSACCRVVCLQTVKEVTPSSDCATQMQVMQSCTKWGYFHCLLAFQRRILT
jgi:hypothetical protein